MALSFCHGATAPSGPRPLHCRWFAIILRRTIVGRTSLDEWSARRRDVCLTTHNTHKTQTSITTSGFESTIPASERQQTHALDCAATGTGIIGFSGLKFKEETSKVLHLKHNSVWCWNLDTSKSRSEVRGHFLNVVLGWTCEKWRIITYSQRDRRILYTITRWKLTGLVTSCVGTAF
jgi:hypothetical protein